MGIETRFFVLKKDMVNFGNDLFVTYVDFWTEEREN